MFDDQSQSAAYYRQREAQERDLARHAMVTEARNAHIELAQRYAELARAAAQREA